VGVYPPPALAAEMVAVAEELASRRAFDGRLTSADQVHLTLQFIGDTPSTRVDDVVESVERSAAGLRSFAIVPCRMVTLPRKRAARLLAIETDTHPTLRELKVRLARRLAHPSRQKPADHFLPHLTLMRLRAPVEIEPLDVPVELSEFDIEAVRLMRSTLHPTGAEHHEIACFHLERGS